MNKKGIMIKFYEAFQNGDWKTMNSFYSKEIIFNDSIFHNLNYLQVKNMWEMLLSNNKMDMNFEINESENDVYVVWTATYTFGPKKRKVINVVTTNMIIQDDLIICHNDNFDIKKWSKQSLSSLPSFLTNFKFMRNKISKNALNKLNNYINKK